MSRRSLGQSSFFDPEFLLPGCLEPGTVPWALARFRSKLFPGWLFVGWRGEKRLGRKAWPAPVLMTLLLLRWSEEGVSRLGSVRRARTDLVWRAAMGLAIGAPTPSERTLRDFERFLRERHPVCGVHRYLLLHEHLVRQCLDAGVVGDRAVWATDSTPMWAYGAMLDTMRLLGDGLRMLCRRWARVTGTALAALATEWELPLLLSKSTKAAYRVDWRDVEQRRGAMNRVARDVIRVVEFIRSEITSVRKNKRKGLWRLCRNLLKVIRNDLETDEDGRLVIARGTAKGRLVSITDPQARHGRKSSSKKYKGFKIHVLGDVVSGLLLSLAVTRGGTHDSVPAHRLIHRARELHGEIERVLGDTAYGGARLRYVVAGTDGVELLSPPPPISTNPDRVERRDMAIDLEVGTATCPEGIRVPMTWSWSTADGMHIRHASWPKATCSACPRHRACVPPTRAARGWGRCIRLHAYEAELVAAREAWERPEVREDYRVRSQCERLVNQVIRHGGRQARAFGLGSANLQAHLIAMRCNLSLLARRLGESTAAAA